MGEAYRMPEIEIPLFPLNTVLFPGGVLPLRIFEPRYVDMVKRCMRAGSAFGVALIRDGNEAGGRATTHGIGTLAQIVDFDQLPDKLLGITTRGTQRFRITTTRLQDDGLHLSAVELLPSDPGIALPEEFARYANLLEQALPQMGDFFKHIEPHYDDASWVSGRLAEIMPLALHDKQRLLEMDDPVERLHVLQPLLRGAAAN
jgi:Lon protease-like protein